MNSVVFCFLSHLRSDLYVQSKGDLCLWLESFVCWQCPSTNEWMNWHSCAMTGESACMSASVKSYPFSMSDRSALTKEEIVVKDDELTFDEECHNCRVWCYNPKYREICGRHPFVANDERRLLELIRAQKLRFDAEKFRHFSPEGLDFLQGMLVYDTVHRRTMGELIAHPWLTVGRHASLNRLMRSFVRSFILGRIRSKSHEGHHHDDERIPSGQRSATRRRRKTNGRDDS